jgi:GT2 family glycosyltransferase
VAEDAVTVGYVHNGMDVAYSWHRCFVELIGYDMTTGGHVIRGGWAATRFSHNIIDARNTAIAGWLDDDSRKHVDWWMWLDTDMGFHPDTVEQLLKVADPEHRPIVGGLCFSQSEQGDDGYGGKRCEPRPTMFKWVPELGTVCVADYPINALVDVAATGSACILIHRSVFETIRKEQGDVWYDRIPNPYVGGMHSEDISFCLRAGSLGFRAFVHTGVRTTHLKNLWLSEVDYWNYRPAPPARERVTIVVPTRGRPDNAEPFMESLRASTSLASVVAVCNTDDPDSVKAWDAAGARTIELDWKPGDFARKMNLGYQAGLDPWIMLVGDDVRFHPAWLDHALHVADLQGADVVGTNDLGNPRVMAGEHATHMLIRRSYIADQGASWDGPGVVCHEGYKHWYVDDEIVTVAKQRGTFAMALGSIVEHLHPLWEKGEDDATYELGQSTAKYDAELWKQRFRRFAQGPKVAA